MEVEEDDDVEEDDVDVEVLVDDDELELDDDEVELDDELVLDDVEDEELLELEVVVQVSAVSPKRKSAIGFRRTPSRQSEQYRPRFSRRE